MGLKDTATKAARKKDPTYRQHATGQATGRIGGRDFYLGAFDSPGSRDAYYRLLASWNAESRPRPWTGPRAEAPTPHTADEITVGEVMLAYLDHAEAYYVKRGHQTSEVAVIQEAIRRLKSIRRLPATEFGPLAFKGIRKSMIADGLSRNTVNAYGSRIKRMFAWATEEELIPAMVYHALQAVRGLRQGRRSAKESEPVRPVPDDHVDAVLPHVSAEVAAMIRLQFLTGMRPGEVVQMQVSDLSMSGSVWMYRPPSHKTEHHGKGRTVYLGPKAQGVIRPFLTTDLSAYLFAPTAAESRRNADHHPAISGS